MSLVGAEVNVRGSASDGRSSPDTTSTMDLLRIPQDSQDNDDDVDDGDDDYHPVTSPMRPAERLFLQDLETKNISAAALAQQLHETHRRSLSGSRTNDTDDFASAVSETDFRASSSISDVDFSSPFKKDALAHSREPKEVRRGKRTPQYETNNTPTSAPSDTPVTPKKLDTDDDLNKSIDHSEFVSPEKTPIRKPELNQSVEAHDDEIENNDSSNMMKTATNATPNLAPKPAPEKTDVNHADPAEKVYETAKNIWSWGKGIVVFRPFLGLAENVAGKVVSMAGANLEQVDKEAKTKLHDIDTKFLNPAIAALVGIVLGVVSATESRLKPLLISILKPVGLIKDEAENPEMTPTSGVTVTR